jgi:hypothetical protein
VSPEPTVMSFRIHAHTQAPAVSRKQPSSSADRRRASLREISSVMAAGEKYGFASSGNSVPRA